MKITITIDKNELRDLIANSLRYKALENGGVYNWSLYHDALSDGLGDDYLAPDGDYWTPYNEVADAIVKEIRKCQ